MAHLAVIDATVRLLLLPQLERLRDEGYDVSAISAPGPWVGEIEARGVRHVAWRHATRTWDPRADLLALRELVGLLRRERFDVLHTHTPKGGLIGRVAARMSGVPCVVNTVHGLYATRQDPLPRRAAVMALEWVAARCSDLELYQSEEDLAWSRRLRVAAREKSAWIGNGTDVRHFDPSAVDAARIAALRAELGIAAGAPVVGTVGRLVREKGYRELAAAARIVRASIPEATFVAVGPDDLDERDGLSADDLGRDLLVTGMRSDVRDLLALMDVFVLPTWREGMPRSAIEAAAMGRAMVLTDIRGCREVVREGVDGLLVPRRDAEALAGAVTRLLRDEGLRRRLGAAARERAVERFDERRVEEAIVTSYRRVLRERGLPAPGAAGGRMAASGDGDEIVIRPARPSEARLMAAFHLRTYAQGYLPLLGEPFLRLLYRAFVRDAEAVALVAERNGEMVGLATGIASVSRFYRRFYLRYGVAAAVALAPRLVRPRILKQVVETARYPGNTRGEFPEAEYTTLAVHPDIRSRGLGGRLTREIIRGLGALGVDRVRATVGAENVASNRMHQRVGFEKVGETSVHDGRTSNVYVIECSSLSPSPSDRS